MPPGPKVHTEYERKYSYLCRDSRQSSVKKSRYHLNKNMLEIEQGVQDIKQFTGDQPLVPKGKVGEFGWRGRGRQERASDQGMFGGIKGEFLK